MKTQLIKVKSVDQNKKTKETKNVRDKIITKIVSYVDKKLNLKIEVKL